MQPLKGLVIFFLLLAAGVGMVLIVIGGMEKIDRSSAGQPGNLSQPEMVEVVTSVPVESAEETEYWVIVRRADDSLFLLSSPEDSFLPGVYQYDPNSRIFDPVILEGVTPCSTLSPDGFRRER